MASEGSVLVYNRVLRRSEMALRFRQPDMAPCCPEGAIVGLNGPCVSLGGPDLGLRGPFVDLMGPRLT